MVMAPDGFVRDNRDAVRAFIEASAEGWRSYLHDDPTPAHRLIRAANPDMPADLLRHARTVLRDQQVVEGGDAATLGIGAMTEARWREFFEVASSQGVYPPNMDWKKAFRLDLLARPA
jgi:NitT/TauT family transport system substrate-binding protein